MEKQELFYEVERRAPEICALADDIFDHPELGYAEHYAAAALCGRLTEMGFTVERGIAGMETAFRAVFTHKGGGPRIGLLCEYDALEGLGHACGHHMQGPSILGAAAALKENAGEQPFTVVVYGTPAEETAHGKLRMLEAGYFEDIDVALMMHGSPTTTVDVRSLASSSFTVIFHGKRSHAALKPEDGRSAFDALLVSMNGVEFLREHVREDTRMHYTVAELPGPPNVVPDRAVGKFSLRSYSRVNLDLVVERFKKIIEGASLIADVTYELKEGDRLDNKIPVLALNDALMRNAALVNAPRQSPPREKTGSSDFSNVMHKLPGSCIRVAMVPPGTSSHSDEFLAAGKGEEAHNAVIIAAKVIAATACDLIQDSALYERIRAEFEQNKAREA